MSELEKAAQLAANEAAEAIHRAITAYRQADYGSHVIAPLQDALQSVRYSISEVKS